MYRITEKKKLAENIWEIEVEAPEIAAKARPGQFVVVRTGEKSERIPLTIADYDREKGTLTLVVQTVGFSSTELCSLNSGDGISNIAGPLGEASEITGYGNAVLVAGGVGTAPVYPIARALREAGNRVTVIIGARCSDLHFWTEKMKEAADEVIIMTDDGSLGRKGLVTVPLGEIAEKGEADIVWAIGPMIMMKAASETTRPYGIKTIVSLNPIMVDGTGMCGACRVSVGGETKFACVEGPEFDGHLVDFDLAMKRMKFYSEEEKAAKHKCGSHDGEGGGCRCGH